MNNLAIEYQDQGSGPTVLAIHGWQDTLHTFDPLAKHLEAHARLVRLDLPGFGASEMPKEVWMLSDYVDLVAAFIQKLHLSVDVLMGHSLGGRIVLKGAGDGTLKSSKIVLISAAGIAKTGTARNRAIKAVAKVGKVVTLVPPLSMWRGQLRTKLYQKAGSDYLNAGELSKTFLNIINEDLKSSASKVRQSTLLVWGKGDTETPPEDGEILASLIAGSKLVILPDTDHFVHQQESAQVACLIEEFIR